MSSAENDNRRQYQRIHMTEDAVAVDDTGLQLGRVLQASGGGMQVDAASHDALQRMRIGARLRVTIVEPGSGTTNTMDVEVRHIAGTLVGMQFV